MKLLVGHLYPEYLNIYADRGNIAVLGRGARPRGHRARACGRSASATRCRRPSTSSTSAAARIASRRSSRPISPAKAGALARGGRRRRGVPRRLRRLPAARPLLPRPERRRAPGRRASAAAHGRRRAAHDRRRPARLRLGRRDARRVREPRAAARSSTRAPSRSAASCRASATTAARARGLPGRAALYGTYLHGPLLPRNPWFADRVLAEALAPAPAGRSSSSRSPTSSSGARTRSPRRGRGSAAAARTAWVDELLVEPDHVPARVDGRRRRRGRTRRRPARGARRDPRGRRRCAPRFARTARRPTPRSVAGLPDPERAEVDGRIARPPALEEALDRRVEDDLLAARRARTAGGRARRRPATRRPRATGRERSAAKMMCTTWRSPGVQSGAIDSATAIGPSKRDVVPEPELLAQLAAQRLRRASRRPPRRRRAAASTPCRASPAGRAARAPASAGAPTRGSAARHRQCRDEPKPRTPRSDSGSSSTSTSSTCGIGEDDELRDPHARLDRRTARAGRC